MAWLQNQLVWITSDLSLGPARIIEDDVESFYVVRFLKDQSTRRFSKKHPPFRRVEIREGQRLTLSSGKKAVVSAIASTSPIIVFETEFGESDESEIKDLANDFGVTDLVEHQHFTPFRSFLLRKEALELQQIRENHRFKGISGCRVDLLEHQLWLTVTATESAEVRALLCDEVGLGKTIEAGLIFSRLLAQKKLSKVLVLVPEALKVQWLTELYRRFNIRFRMDHEEMIEDDDYRDFVISSFDRVDLINETPDLIIVDEAHRILETSVYGATADLVRKSKHALLLTATPLVKGSDGLDLLVGMLKARDPKSTPQLFSSKRKDVAIKTWRSVEPVFVLNREDWIVEQLRSIIDRKSKEKVFLITSTADQVKRLFEKLAEKIGRKIACFHEEMDLIERDRQAAYFSDPEGAQFLIASEIGGEGRNFQFASRMILCDLPRDPAVLEQRIGRLDRIGQKQKVIVHCPVQENTDDEFMFELHRDVFETFDRPWTGASLRDSSQFQESFDRAFENRSLPDLSELKKNLAAAPIDLKQLESKLGFRLYGYRSTTPPLIPELKTLDGIEVRSFLEELYELFGVEVEDFDSHGALKISASSLMFVDYFPGLGSDGEKVLTFERSTALAREDFTYCSIDHPDFLESVELLLGTDNGRLAIAKPKSGMTHKKDLQLLMIFRETHSPNISRYSYSHAMKELKESAADEGFDHLETVDFKRLPPAFLEQLAQEFKSISYKTSLDPKLKDRVLDSLLVVIPF